MKRLIVLPCDIAFTLVSSQATCAIENLSVILTYSFSTQRSIIIDGRCEFSSRLGHERCCVARGHGRVTNAVQMIPNGNRSGGECKPDSNSNVCINQTRCEPELFW